MTSTLKILGVVALGLALLVMAVPAEAQSGVAFLKTGALTATNSACTATACVQMPVIAAANGVGIQITGTFVGTITFEVSVDGTNWVAAAAAVTVATEARVTTATAPGLWQINVAGYTGMRARCTAFTSGTITVTLNRSAGTPGNGT